MSLLCNNYVTTISQLYHYSDITMKLVCDYYVISMLLL